MKRYLSIALFGILFALAIGFISLNNFSATSLFVTPSSINSERATILGHVTYIVKDSAGNIKQYLQTDNVVVDSGKKCIAAIDFATNATSATCTQTQTRSFAGTSSGTTGWNWIAIGNSTGTIDATTTKLPSGSCTHCGEMARLQDGKASITQPGGSGTSVQVTLQRTFTFVTANATIVQNSGLFNMTSGVSSATFNTPGGTSLGALLAAQSLPTPVTVTNGDTLTVNWTINIG